MADDGANPFERGQLKREATDWFIRMRDEGADKLRPEFEAWLARGALHRAAYNRVANLYGAGKNVNWESLPPPRPVRGAMKLTMLSAAGAMVLVAFLLWRALVGPLIPIGGDGAQPSGEVAAIPSLQLMSRLGEIRRVSLSDGSQITLDTDSLVTVDFRNDERELRLERGRARFDVAHERRPFVVDAGDTEVIAHGTEFDVALWNDHHVDVALLRGSIDVNLRPREPGPTKQLVAHLRPGDGLHLRDAAGVSGLRPERRVIQDWPTGFMDFDDEPLADLVDIANRYTPTKIRFGDPSTGRLRVSGTFRIDDGARLARSLADLFDLSISSQPGAIVLSAKRK
jgi:transmembrane sensor